MNKTLIFYLNFILILIFIPIKIIDFLMSLLYIGTNNIVETNPFGYIFLENPLFMFTMFIILLLFYILSNFIIYKMFQELMNLLLSILILNNLIGIYVLINNFQILLTI